MNPETFKVVLRDGFYLSQHRFKLLFSIKKSLKLNPSVSPETLFIPGARD